MILTLSGVDCSGKSTHVRLLENALRSRGRRSSVVWFRPGYSPALDALRALVRSVRPQALPKAGQSQQRDQAFRKPAVRAAWIAMALGDTLMQLAARVRLLSLAGRVVICDRYLADAMLDLELRFPEFAIARSSVSAALMVACPRPARAFLLTLPKDEMLRRMDKKQEPFPDPPEIRDARYEAYATMSSGGRFAVIDASREVEAVHADILAHLPTELRA